VVGSVAGCAGSISSLIGAAITLAIGRIVTIGSFTPIFIVYSMLPMAGFGAVCLLIRRLGTVRDFPG
jgi:hypothetical protein